MKISLLMFTIGNVSVFAPSISDNLLLMQTHQQDIVCLFVQNFLNYMLQISLMPLMRQSCIGFVWHLALMELGQTIILDLAYLYAQPLRKHLEIIQLGLVCLDVQQNHSIKKELSLFYLRQNKEDNSFAPALNSAPQRNLDRPAFGALLPYKLDIFTPMHFTRLSVRSYFSSIFSSRIGQLAWSLSPKTNKNKNKIF